MISAEYPLRPLTTGELLDRAFSLYRRNFWKFVGTLAGVLLLLSPALAAEDSPPLPLDAYWNLVETTHTRLTELADTPLEDARPVLKSLAIQWDTVTAVELPDGTILPIDTRYFSTQLRAEEPDLPALTGLLENILTLRPAESPNTFSATDLAALTDILARPEFQWQAEQPNPIQQFLQDLLRRINNAFLRFLEWLFPDTGGVIALPFELIFTIIGSILLIFLFIYIFRGTWGNLIAEAENGTHGDGETAPLTADAARQRARELSQAGDHRTAIRYLYLASLLLLEERGLLRYDRTLTNRETLRSVANRPDLAAPLQEVVETFDRVWYGYQDVDEPTFEHYAERVEDLRQQK